MWTWCRVYYLQRMYDIRQAAAGKKHEVFHGEERTMFRTCEIVRKLELYGNLFKLTEKIWGMGNWYSAFTYLFFINVQFSRRCHRTSFEKLPGDMILVITSFSSCNSLGREIYLELWKSSLRKANEPIEIRRNSKQWQFVDFTTCCVGNKTRTLWMPLNNILFC